MTTRKHGQYNKQGEWTFVIIYNKVLAKKVGSVGAKPLLFEQKYDISMKG